MELDSRKPPIEETREENTVSTRNEFHFAIEDEDSNTIRNDSSEEYENEEELSSVSSTDSNDFIEELGSENSVIESDLEQEDVMEDQTLSEVLRNSHFDTLDYRLTSYAKFVVDEGISLECLQRLDNLMCLMYGYPPMFTKKDVVKVIKDIGNNVIAQKLYFCNRCGRQKLTKREECPNCLVNTKNLLETITFVKCNLEFQLQKLLEIHAKEIITSHRKILTNQAVFEASDIRRYPGYKKHVETMEQHKDHRINLICTISSDGAVFKRISRREATPVFLKVEGLNVITKKNGNSLCLIGISFSDGGIKKNLIQKLVGRYFEDLENVEIKVTIGETTYVFTPVIMSVLCDMKEQALLTSLPNWHQVNGCSRCLTNGKTKSRGKISYDNYIFSKRRTDEEMMISSINKADGFTCEKAPEIYKHVAPTTVNIDPFHVRGCGICKQIVTEFLKPKAWKSFKIRTSDCNSIRKAIESIVPYTSESVKTQSFKKLSKCSGREWDKLSIYVCALISISGCCTCNDFNALLLGWYFSLEFSGSILAPPTILRKLLNYCYELHVHLQRDSLTIKWHTFYDHIVEHEEAFGHLHTTEVYEREHKTLMTSVNHQTTSCEISIVERYCARKILQSKLQQDSQQHSQNLRERIESCMKGYRRTSFDEENVSNFLNREDLIPEHQELLQDISLSPFCRFKKRIQIKSLLGSFCFSGYQYWKNTNSTSSHIAFVDPINGMFRYGQIEFIFVNEQRDFVLCRQFELEPLRITLNGWTKNNLSRVSQHVVECCFEFPTSIGKIIGELYSIVPSSSILCPSVVICHENVRIVKICMK